MFFDKHPAYITKDPPLLDCGSPVKILSLHKSSNLGIPVSETIRGGITDRPETLEQGFHTRKGIVQETGCQFQRSSPSLHTLLAAEMIEQGREGRTYFYRQSPSSSKGMQLRRAAGMPREN